MYNGLCNRQISTSDIIEYAINDIENRKIRIAVVNKVVKNKNDNFIHGLKELTELWTGLEYPADAPHTIQGRDNDILPTEYYTQENYNILFEKNKEWLTRELEYLTHQ